jgi:hypothetical protein
MEYVWRALKKVELSIRGGDSVRLRGTDIFSGKSLDVYATIITDPTSTSNGRPVLLVEGLDGEMIEMDHANFALGSYCVAEATERELEDFYQWSQWFSISDYK